MYIYIDIHPIYICTYTFAYVYIIFTYAEQIGLRYNNQQTFRWIKQCNSARFMVLSGAQWSAWSSKSNE